MKRKKRWLILLILVTGLYLYLGLEIELDIKFKLENPHPTEDAVFSFADHLRFLNGLQTLVFILMAILAAYLAFRGKDNPD